MAFAQSLKLQLTASFLTGAALSAAVCLLPRFFAWRAPVGQRTLTQEMVILDPTGPLFTLDGKKFSYSDLPASDSEQIFALGRQSRDQARQILRSVALRAQAAKERKKKGVLTNDDYLKGFKVSEKELQARIEKDRLAFKGLTPEALRARSLVTLQSQKLSEREPEKATELLNSGRLIIHVAPE